MSIANQLSNAISWWVKGLKYCLPDQAFNLFSSTSKQIRLHYDSGTIHVTWPSESIANKFELDDPLKIDELKSKLSHFLHEKYLCTLVLPATTGLGKQVSLPISAEKNLDQIMRFEIERQSPFTHSQVLYAYRTTHRDKGNQKLLIDFSLLPKRVIEPVLDKFEQAHIHLDQLFLENSSINLLPDEKKRKKKSNALARINLSLLFLTLALIGATLIIPYFQARERIHEINTELEQTKKRAMEVTQLKSAYEKKKEEQAFLRQKVSERLSMTHLIDEVTKSLPDNTSLTRLQIREKQITLHGESANATSLIGILDKNALFLGTRFQSPVTTNISTGKDRFQITARINNQTSGEAK